LKQTRRSPEQVIAAKLREAGVLLGGGASIGQVCQKPGVAEATYLRQTWNRTPLYSRGLLATPACTRGCLAHNG